MPKNGPKYGMKKKPGTAERRTVEHGMSDHQIWNGKTQNTKSGIVKTRKTKSRTIKPGTLNLECQFTDGVQFIEWNSKTQNIKSGKYQGA